MTEKDPASMSPEERRQRMSRVVSRLKEIHRDEEQQEEVEKLFSELLELQMKNPKEMWRWYRDLAELGEFVESGGMAADELPERIREMLKDHVPWFRKEEKEFEAAFVSKFASEPTSMKTYEPQEPKTPWYLDPDSGGPNPPEDERKPGIDYDC